MSEFRSTAFALFGSSIMQFCLLACLGLWCGWRPFDMRQPTRSSVVHITLSRPTPKALSETHSAISSNLRAASARARRLLDRIDKHIQPALEYTRTVKPVHDLPPTPQQKPISHPSPVAGSLANTIPLEQMDHQNLSSRLLEIRKRMALRSPRTAPSGVSPEKSSDSGPSAPPSTGEISAYLDLVRRGLEKAKRYPASARKRGLGGTVMLTFRIEADGSASGPTAEGNAPRELRDDALALIRDRRFPAPPKGWNTHARMEIPVKYTLKETGFK